MRWTVLLLCAAVWGQEPAPYKITEGERRELRGGLETLGKRVAALRTRGADAALLADVEIYHKAVEWLLRFEEEFYTKEFVAHARRSVERGLARAAELERGSPAWPAAKGRVARAYRSRVDGGVQPYGVYVPESYDGRTPMRLDVILHGRNRTLTEAGFLAAQETAKPSGTAWLELHVFGRGNNAYRWAGETDVFEALASVRERYRVDPNRVVLRGFSMGGAGAWHLGLHRPDWWAAVEAGAGFTETLKYAKLADAPPHWRKAWRFYDAVEYARNAWQVPVVGYGGEEDPQLQASVNILHKFSQEGLARADLRTLFLVGPKTAHKWHPESKRESDVFLDAAAREGRRTPDHVRFVTFTTRFNRCFWVTVEGLDRHYERAEVDARREAGGVVVKTRNVSRLRLDTGGRVTVDGQEAPGGLIEKRDGRWAAASSSPAGLRKRHGLQGPIDDAFFGSFLCVKPSKGGTPPALVRFEREFAKYMRGSLRVKTDAEVTEEDIREHHLALFGDPAANRLMARVRGQIPFPWDRFAGKDVALVYPNPLNPRKYVVWNTGHTFGEAEFQGSNALLFPRLGDWAVRSAGGEVIAAGFFDDYWRFAE